ncbi:hypothetical protein Tco_0580366 [Tanacetum coccineum]
MDDEPMWAADRVVAPTPGSAITIPKTANEFAITGVRLADRSFQYPIGIAENMLVEVGKFTFLADFVILEMEEDSKDEILEEDFDALLDEGSKILHSIEGTLLKEEIFAKFDEFHGYELR